MIKTLRSFDTVKQLAFPHQLIDHLYSQLTLIGYFITQLLKLDVIKVRHYEQFAALYSDPRLHP